MLCIMQANFLSHTSFLAALPPTLSTAEAAFRTSIRAWSISIRDLAIYDLISCCKEDIMYKKTESASVTENELKCHQA